MMGAAIATAVLTGALLVGDSVRGSLRDLALDRLGRIEVALVSDRFINEGLADRIDAEAPVGARGSPAAVPAILVRGTSSHGRTMARASRIDIVGIDDRFTGLFPAGGAEDAWPPLRRAPGDPFPPVVLNASLSRELGASPGDPVLVTVPRAGDAPLGTVLGSRDPESRAATIRCRVAGVVPDRGAGRFTLSGSEIYPRDAFVPLADLQRALGREQKVNAFLIPAGRRTAGEPPVETRLAGLLDLDDRGLLVSRTADHVAIESREFVLRPEVVEAIGSVADSLGAGVQRIQTYLAIEMRSPRGNAIPYATVTAADPAGPPFPGLTLADGSPAPRLREGEILLNRWAADDLGARPDDEIRMEYFVVGDREELRTQAASFRVKGVVEMTGMAADRTLTPDYPGIKGARHMASWNPPFPIELGRVRPIDERYWDLYGATPKAFVSEADGRRLWSSRFGSTTAVRIAPPAGADLQAFAARLTGELRRRLPPELFGIRARRVRQEGLAAAEGTTDFGSLFLAFSFFLILSASMLTGLLFRLGVERRAREVGVLLATGRSPRHVLATFLGEGLIVAAAGTLPGLAAGAGYAALLMLGLRTIWRAAAGSAPIALHARASSLAAAEIASLVAVMAAIVWAVRRLGRAPVPSLLAGHIPAFARKGASRISSRIAWPALGVTVALAGGAIVMGGTSSPALSFAAGASALACGLAFFATWCRAPRRRRSWAGRHALAAMAARNSAWNPGRSILSVALVASACFVIVVVGANRQEAEAPGGLDAGDGGYALVGASDLPLPQDLDTTAGRAESGLPASSEALLSGARIMPFKVVPGDDASCLSLSRPVRPRILGVPEQQIRRGGFRFQSTIRKVANPWDLLEQEIAPGVVPAFGDQNSVLWILHLGLGRDLIVEDEAGRPLRLRFVGLLQGSLFQSEVLISERLLLAHFPSRGGYAFFLIDTRGAPAGPIAAVLEGALAAEGFDVTASSDRIAAYHAVENTYLSTFLLLGGLGVLLGTAGLGIAILRNVIDRRAELAALRAFGFPRRRLAAMVLSENAFLLCLGMLIGSGAGLVAAAPRLVEQASGGSWVPTLAILAGVLAAGMASSLAAVAGALRAPLLPVLKQEH